MKKSEPCDQPQGGVVPSQALRNLAQRTELRGTGRELLGMNLVAYAELPESCQDIAVLRAAMNSKLLLDFKNRLSAQEQNEVVRYSAEFFLPPHLGPKWDRFIFEAARQYGARLFLSDHVMARVWAWAGGETGGSVKLERLFRVMRHSVRVGLKVAKGKITDRHRLAKKRFVAELELLQVAVQNAWPDGNTPAESAEKIRRFIAQRVESELDLLNLKANDQQLQRFIDDENALAFRGKERPEDALTPTQFCTKWFARSENISYQYARQRLLTRSEQSSRPGKK